MQVLNKSRKKEHRGGHRLRKCILGVCAMDKKCRSKPMQHILDRLRAYGDFLIIVFGEKMILDDKIPVEAW